MGMVNAKGYSSHQNKDSHGKDIRHMPGVNVATLSKACDNDSRCKGFNTGGWLKHEILPEQQWNRFGNKPSHGLYVKDAPPAPAYNRWAKKPAPVAPVVDKIVKAATVDLPNYLFYQGKDSGGNDIGHFPGTPKEIMIKCNSEPKCKGFNTNGWVKHTILPKDKWVKWSGDATKGMYLRQGMAQSAVATVSEVPPSMLEVPDVEKVPTYVRKEVIAAPPVAATVVKATPVAGPAKKNTRWSGRYGGRRGRGEEHFESNLDSTEFLIAADMSDLVNENSTWGSYLVVLLFIMLVVTIAMIYMARSKDAAYETPPPYNV